MVRSIAHLGIALHSHNYVITDSLSNQDYDLFIIGGHG